MNRILIAEDEPGIASFLEKGLRAQGFTTLVIENGPVAANAARDRDFDLLILDIGLPGLDGHGVLAEIRRRGERMPVIMLTARKGVSDTVHGLEGGADDYVTKPFGMDELLARLRAAMRRSTPAEEEAVVETEHFSVDLAAKRIMTPDGEVKLTPTEWNLVEILVRNAGKLVTQRQLLQEVWGPQYERETNYLRVYFAQIRRKLEPDPARPRYFITEARMGYRFSPS